MSLRINLSDHYSPVRWVELKPLAVQFLVNHDIVSLIFQTLLYQLRLR